MALSLVPNRSNGVPLNPFYRNPPPGANPPLEYTDTVTAPASDIAENPYWKRDTRRAYPRPSVISQGDVIGLLTVGSKAAPKEEVLRIGEEGTKQLAEVKQDGEERGLAVFFEENKGSLATAFNGLPPKPVNLSSTRYSLLDEEEQAYPTSK